MRKSKKIIIIAVVIALVVIAIFLLITFNKKTPRYEKLANKVTYNYYVFNKGQDNAWYLDLNIRNQLYTIPFYYTPFDAEDIYIDNNTIKTMALYLNNNPRGNVYVSVDPYQTTKIVIAGVEISRLLGDKYDIFNFNVKSAISKEYNDTLYPFITCKDAHSKLMVVMFNISDKNSITSSNNCIVLNSKNVDESIRVADAFSFRILGITR